MRCRRIRTMAATVSSGVDVDIERLVRIHDAEDRGRGSRVICSLDRCCVLSLDASFVGSSIRLCSLFGDREDALFN